MARLTPIDYPRQPQAFDVGAQPEVHLSDGSDDVVYNTSRRMAIWCDNQTGGVVNVRLPGQRTCDFHHDVHDADVPVPDGFTGYIAMELDYSRFNDSGHDVTIQYDVGGLLVAAVDLA